MVCPSVNELGQEVTHPQLFLDISTLEVYMANNIFYLFWNQYLSFMLDKLESLGFELDCTMVECRVNN